MYMHIFRIGRVLDSNYVGELQFKGMVTSINIFFGRNEYKINKICEAICNNDGLEADLSWKHITWRKIGSDIVEKNIDLKKICQIKDSEPISLPFLWKAETAAEVCNRIGNGNVTDFSDPGDVSKIDITSVYGDKLEKCQYIWSPYNDVENEGVYVNANTGGVIEKIDWEPAQPNGLYLENHVAILPSIVKFRDIAGSTYACTSCTIPHKVLTLRGSCENSYLGIIIILHYIY